MEVEIKRVNFFNEQFLQEQEFRDEQTYHQHLHRRLNYMLFESSGVVPVQAIDLAIEPENPPADKRFRVRAGAAISRRVDLFEGREIVLRADTDLIDLAVDGPFLLDGPLIAGQTAVVTIHFEHEEELALNLANNQMAVYRLREQAVVRVHTNSITTSPPEGEQYITLGTIAFDDMAVDMTLVPDGGPRQQALIRGGLVSGSSGPALVSIDIQPADPVIVPGLTVTLEAVGEFSDASTRTLTASDGVTWSSSAPTTADFTGGFGVLEGLNAGTAVITAQAGAILATTSATVALPTIDGVVPNFGPAGTTITVTGTLFASPMTVNFFDPAGPRVSVPALVLNPTQATAVVPGPPAATGPLTVTVGTAESAPGPAFAIL